VFLVAGNWLSALLEEMEAFPAGKYRDQVDACSSVFHRLAIGPRYSLDSGLLD
jgi:phage terminase large subunit-like protein